MKALLRKDFSMTKEKLGKLIIAKRDTMWRIAISILGNELDSEDAIGNTIVKAFENWEKIREDKYAATWLLRILINECHNIQRTMYMRMQREIPLDETIPAINMVEEKVRHDVEITELYRAVNKLPEELKIPILLHYIEDYSLKEIAMMEEVPVGTMKSRMKRAREKLKELLKDKV